MIKFIDKLMIPFIKTGELIYPNKAVCVGVLNQFDSILKRSNASIRIPRILLTIEKIKPSVFIK